MGRRANWPPKVTIHKASGAERVRYKGEDYPLGPAGSDQARRAYAELLARLVALGEGPSGERPLTLGQAVQLWRVEALCRYGEGNHELSEHDSAWGYALALFRDRPAPQFGVKELRQARDAMAQAGLSRGVINRRVTRIRTAVRWLDEEGHLPPGSWSALRALSPLRAGDRRAKSHPPVQPAEWPAVAAVCRKLGPVPRALVLAQWFTGARPSELFKLTCGQLRRTPDNTGQCRTGTSDNIGCIVVTLAKHKTAAHGKARALVFGPRALAAVAKALEGRADDDLAFPTRRGTPFNRTSYHTAVYRAAKKAGVKLVPYSLRRAAATRLTAAFGSEVARCVLGHSDVATTEIYITRDLNAAIDAARKCG